MNDTSLRAARNVVVWGPSRKEAPVPDTKPRTVHLSLVENNLYGRRTIPGMTQRVPTRRDRRRTHLNQTLVYPSKNGVYDPLTFYHVLDVLLQLDTGETFRTGDLVKILREAKPQFLWDQTTVGRVLNDIADTVNEVHGGVILGVVRRWDGMNYYLPAEPVSRAALLDLLEDLAILSERWVEHAHTRAPEKRLNSPMNYCPSVQDITARTG